MEPISASTGPSPSSRWRGRHRPGHGRQWRSQHRAGGAVPGQSSRDTRIQQYIPSVVPGPGGLQYGHSVGRTRWRRNGTGPAPDIERARARPRRPRGRARGVALDVPAPTPFVPVVPEEDAMMLSRLRSRAQSALRHPVLLLTPRHLAHDLSARPALAQDAPSEPDLRPGEQVVEAVDPTRLDVARCPRGRQAPGNSTPMAVPRGPGRGLGVRWGREQGEQAAGPRFAVVLGYEVFSPG